MALGLDCCINNAGNAQEPLNNEADRIQISLNPEERFNTLKQKHPVLLYVIGLPFVILHEVYRHAFDYGNVETRRNGDKIQRKRVSLLTISDFNALRSIIYIS